MEFKKKKTIFYYHPFCFAQQFMISKLTLKKCNDQKKKSNHYLRNAYVLAHPGYPEYYSDNLFLFGLSLVGEALARY